MGTSCIAACASGICTIASTVLLIIEFTLGVLGSDKRLQTEQENDDRDNEKGEDENAHYDYSNAHALAGADENDCHSRVIIIINTVHGDVNFNGFS